MENAYLPASVANMFSGLRSSHCSTEGLVNNIGPRDSKMAILFGHHASCGGGDLLLPENLQARVLKVHGDI